MIEIIINRLPLNLVAKRVVGNSVALSAKLRKKRLDAYVPGCLSTLYVESRENFLEK